MSPEVVRGLVQPDQRTCGPSSMVAAQMLLDPAYAARVREEDGFGEEVLDRHRTLTAAVDGSGASQLPWPRALGTPPWAVARELTRLTGARYDIAVVLLRDRGVLVTRAQASLRADRPVAIYVGDRWLPRHVVLAVTPTPDGLTVYNPASGAVLTMRTEDVEASTLRTFGRWTTPWFLVLPRG